MDTWAKKLCPRPIVLSLGGAIAILSAHGCIHLGADIDTILIYIQWTESLNPRDDPKPYACSHRSVFKSHLASTDTNKYDIGHLSNFASVNSTSSATSSIVIIDSTTIGTCRGSLTRRDTDIPRAPKTRWTVNQGCTSILNYRIHQTTPPLYPCLNLRPNR